MYNIADVLEHRIPSLKSFDPVGLVKNFEESILKELDFIHESINIQRFYNHIKLDDSAEQFANAPAVYPKYTTGKVLAMEFMSGIKINALEEIEEKGYDKIVLARRLTISYFKQIFEYGFFHADPHPGNLIIEPNQHICYLDFGMMGSILPRDIEIFGRLFLAITQKDVNKIIRALQQLSNNMAIDNMRALEFDVNEFVEKYYVRSVEDNEMSTILLDLRDIIIEHDLVVPTHFYLFIRSLVTIEGVIDKLDPDLDQFEIVKPYLIRSVSRSYNPIKMGEKALNAMYELGNYMEELPRDIKNVIRKINSGMVKVDLTHQGIDPMVHTINRVTKQIIGAFIMVALIVGATMFIIYKVEPLWKGFSAIGVMAIILAFIIAFFMIRDIRKGDHDTDIW
jgi:ubiquinone biosynthesis protein